MAEDTPAVGLHGCTGTTKKGLPCTAWPLKGRDVCMGHADRETQASAGFGGSEVGKLGGRPALPKPTDLARQLMERHAAAMLRPHFKALGLYLEDDGSTRAIDGAVVVHNGEATSIEDLGAQIAAAERLWDRVYGKPKQATELSGHVEHAVTGLEGLSDAELLKRLGGEL